MKTVVTEFIRNRPDLPPIDPTIRERLKQDIAARGCRVQIVVTADGHIIGGRARAEICGEPGIDVPKSIVPILGTSERDEMRLALNVFQRQLSREQVGEMISWELARTPQESDRAIAARVGVDHKTVGRLRSTGENFQSARVGLDCRARWMPRKSTAIIYTSSETDARNASKVMASEGATLRPGPISLRKAREALYRLERADRAKGQSPIDHRDYRVDQGDFRDVGIEDDSVNLIVTDPPWAARKDLADDLAKAALRILKGDEYRCVYTGSSYQDQWSDAFRDVGLERLATVVALKPSPGDLLPSGIRSMHTPICVFKRYRGRSPRKLVLCDVMQSSGAEKGFHPWKQPLAESVHLIRALSSPGDLVSDLTCGRGTVGVATVQAGEGRRFVGMEIDQETAVSPEDASTRRFMIAFNK